MQEFARYLRLPNLPACTEQVLSEFEHLSALYSYAAAVELLTLDLHSLTGSLHSYLSDLSLYVQEASKLGYSLQTYMRNHFGYTYDSSSGAEDWRLAFQIGVDFDPGELDAHMEYRFGREEVMQHPTDGRAYGVSFPAQLSYSAAEVLQGNVTFECTFSPTYLACCFEDLQGPGYSNASADHHEYAIFTYHPGMPLSFDIFKISGQGHWVPGFASHISDA